LKKLVTRRHFPAALVVFAAVSLTACRSMPEYPLHSAQISLTPSASAGDPFPIEFNPAPGPSPTSPTPAPLPTQPPLPASPTPVPTQTHIPSPTPTPTPFLLRLTEDGCCTQPFWSPDGREVLFFDKPSPETPAGLWALEIDSGAQRLVTESAGIYSHDLSLAAFLVNGETVVENLSDGARNTIPNGGRAVFFSPSGVRLAWVAGSIGPPIDTAWREVSVSSVEGDFSTRVFGAYGGVLAGWSPAGQLLVSGRINLSDDRQTFWAVDPDGGIALELGRGFVLRGGLPSPGGTWLVYQALFSEHSEENGLWISNITSGLNIRLDLFGSYRWRDDERLLVFHANPGTGEHELWQVVASTGLSNQIRGLEGTGHKIGGGDWQVSPSGDRLVFVSAADYSLWILNLD
jgi:hypothetical protein